MKRGNRAISLIAKNTFSKTSLFTRLYSLQSLSKINNRSQIIYSTPISSSYLCKFHTSRSLLAEHQGTNRSFQRADQDRTVHISNLPPNTLQSDIEALVQDIGGYQNCRVIFDAFSGRCRGFAFITFDSPDAAQKFMADKPKLEYQGNLLKISESTTLDKANSIYVGNLPWEVTPEKIQSVFGKFGQVVKVNLPKRFDGRGRGFAFIYFKDRDAAEKAIFQGNITIDDRQVLISAPVAKTREQGFSADRKEDDAFEL